MSGIERKLKSMNVGDIEYFDSKARTNLQNIMSKLKRKKTGKWTATSKIGKDRVLFESELPLVKVIRLK